MLRIIPRLARVAPVVRHPQKIFFPFRKPFVGFASQSWSLTQTPKVTTPILAKLDSLFLKPSLNSSEHFLHGIFHFHDHEHHSHQVGYNHWALAFGPGALPALHSLESLLELRDKFELTFNQSHYALIVIHAKKIKNILETFQLLANEKFSIKTNQALFEAVLNNVNILDSAKDMHAWLIKKGINSEENYLILAEEVATGRMNCLLEAKFNSECIDRMRIADEKPSLSNLLKELNVDVADDQLVNISSTCQQNLIDLLKTIKPNSEYKSQQLKLIIHTLLQNPHYLGEICKAFLAKQAVDKTFSLTPEWVNSKLYDYKMMDEIRMSHRKQFGLFSHRCQVATEPVAVEHERSLTRGYDN
ncbi:MAG: hypothetical protein ACYCQI_03970 [Gammaproteobacteria bacterium]